MTYAIHTASGSSRRNNIDLTRISWLKKTLFCAALFMLLPVPVMQYIGEESWYTLTAYEMAVNHQWGYQTLMGFELSKTPLFNWLIIAMTTITGWQHLEMAPRLVSVLSSWGSAAVVFYMARRLYPERSTTPWLAALIYLTMGEVSFWYGWLGYADACFGFFIFASIAALWVAIEDGHAGWFALALLLIITAFMVKNISCYAVFGLAGITLLWRLKRWHLLLKPVFLLPGILALCAPLLYQHYFVPAGSNIEGALTHALYNFTGHSLFDYLKHWISYPLLFLARAFPVTLILIWLYWREKQRFTLDGGMQTLLWLLVICLAPFWFSAGGTPRYLIPFYGMLALLLIGLTIQLDQQRLKLVGKALLIVIILKIPFSVLVLPYIKDWMPERSIVAVVDDIYSITNGQMIRTMNDVSTGLSIGAYLNVRTPDDQVFKWYTPGETAVYILSEVKNPEYGKLVKQYRVRGNETYLYWKP